MPEAIVTGTRFAGDPLHPVNQRREAVIDALASDLHFALPEMLKDIFGSDFPLEEIVVYAIDLARVSSRNSYPVEVRLRPGSDNGRRTELQRQGLAIELDEFVNVMWLRQRPHFSEAFRGLAKSRIEVNVGYEDTSGITYHPGTGERIPWG